MAERKSKFGADIAAEVLKEAAESKPVHTRSEVLASRSKAMAAFGEDVSYERYLWIDPALCVPSQENARQYQDLNYENCQELIDSIKAEGRQRFAAVVRQTEDVGKPYEIVAGMRRHFAISWLRANNYSNFRCRPKANRMKLIKTGQSGLSNKKAISTLLMHNPSPPRSRRAGIQRISKDFREKLGTPTGIEPVFQP